MLDKHMEFIDKAGKRREGVEVSCETCNAVFVTRKDQPSRFCQRSCVRRESSVRVECSWCKHVTQRFPSRLKQSKSGLFFCDRKCKEAAQRIGGIQEIMPGHYGSASLRSPDVYRRLYKEAKGIVRLSCERCGYDEFECGVDVHHVDGDFTNNVAENLVAWCAPCHRAFHLGLWH